MLKIRSSSLSSYPDCNRREAAKVFPADIEAAGFRLNKPMQNIGAAVGTSLHTGAMWGMGVKKETGEFGNKTESEQRSLASFKKQREEGVSFDQTTPDANTGEKQIIRQLHAYRVIVAPRVTPTAVETRLEGKATENITLSGQSDTREVHSIRDLKGGKRNSYHGAQLGAYTLLARAHGEDIRKAFVDWVPRTSMKKEQPPPITIEYDMGRSEQLAVQTMKAIERDHARFLESGDAETFLPNPGSMLCGPKYCPAFGTTFCYHHHTQGKEE